MYLQQLALTNIRNLADTTVRFEEPGPEGPLTGVTVITGINGAGKTSLLQAIVHCLLGPVATNGGPLRLLREGASSGSVAAVLSDRTAVHRRTLELTRSDGAFGPSEDVTFDGRPLNTAGGMRPTEPIPFIAAYSAMRLDSPATRAVLDETEKRERRYSWSPRATAAVRSLMQETSPAWTPTRDLPGGEETWLADMEIEREVLTGRRGEIASLISDILFDRQVHIEAYGSKELRMSDSKGHSLGLNEAPGGYRDLTRWVGDLLTRMAIHLERDPAPLPSVRGIVLVDEIELHLHPRWQKELLYTLGFHLPNIQFVVTTHSPIVLCGLESSSVRVFVEDEGGRSAIYEFPDGRLPHTVDEILLGPWFNLHNVRPPAQLARLAALELDAQSGKQSAAEAFIEELLRDSE